MKAEDITQIQFENLDVDKVVFRGVVIWPVEGVLVVDKNILFLNSENNYTDYFNVTTSIGTQWTFE